MFEDNYKKTQLGYLPNNWDVVTLGDIADYINGYAFKPEQWETKGRPIIRIQNLTGSSDTVNYFSGDLDNRYFVTNGDLLISWSASLDAFIWNRGEAWLNQHIFKIDNIHQNCDKGYLYFALKHIIGSIRAKTRGSTMKHITRKEFVATPVALPPLPEQRAIAHVLSTVRQAIDATEQVIAAAQGLKRSMMKHLFTYGPVPVDQADQVVLKETEIGEIPTKWEVISFGEISDFKNGINFKKSQKGDNGYLTVDVLNMYSDGIDIGMDKLYRVDIDLTESYLLKPGDILFVRSSFKREGVGWASLFPGYKEPVTYCGFIIRARLETNVLNSEFLTYYFRLPSVRENLISKSGKVAITNINQGNLSTVPVIVPKLSEQANIVDLLAIVENKIQTEIQKLSAQEQLFSSLLHHLMTGNVSVPYE